LIKPGFLIRTPRRFGLMHLIFRFIDIVAGDSLTIGMKMLPMRFWMRMPRSQKVGLTMSPQISQTPRLRNLRNGMRMRMVNKENSNIH
jgi:hypothetical protein